MPTQVAPAGDAAGHGLLDGGSGMPSGRSSRAKYLAKSIRGPQDVNGEHAFIIHPESAFSLYWSLLMSFLIFYATLMVPVRISFDIGTSKTSPALWIDLFVDVLFAIDMYIQTRTAIKKPGNLDEYEFRRAVILRRYLRTWFIVDLVAAVPFDLVFVFGKDIKAEEANLLFTKLLKALRFMRVAKLIKVSKLRQLVSGMEDRLGIFDINPGIRRLAETAVLTFVVSHLTACLWYFVSSTAREANEGSWIESYQDDYGAQDNGSLYLTSLYWSVSTLTSVGFGDIKPANNAERFVATLACWAGATVFGYVIGQMSSMVADLNQISFQYHRKMDSINAYLKYRKVPPQLQKRIRRFFRYYIGRKMLFDESQILNELTHGLKVELSMFLTKDVLRNIHIFKDIKNPSFMSAIVTMLKPFSAAPGDFVIREGDLALEMYLIVRGTVEVLASNGLVYTRLSQGSHFGEITYLDSDVEERRAASVRALTYCDLFSFSKSDVAEVSRNFPEVLKMMHEITERRKTIAKNLRTQRKARKVTTGSKENHFHMIPDNPTGSIPTARPPETPESQQETARVTRRRASIGAMPTVPSIDIGSVSRTSSMTGDTVAQIAPLLRLNSPEPLSPSTSSVGATNAPLSPGIMTLDNTGSVGSYGSYVAAVQNDASYPANSVQFATFSSSHGESSLASDISALKSLLTAQAKELATLTEAINTRAMEDEKSNGRASPNDADKSVDGTMSG